MWRAWELLGDRVVGATSLVQPRESREVAVESPGGHVTEPGEKRLGCRVGRASRGRAVPSVPRTRTSGAPPRPSLRARGRKPHCLSVDATARRARTSREPPWCSRRRAFPCSRASSPSSGRSSAIACDSSSGILSRLSSRIVRTIAFGPFADMPPSSPPGMGEAYDCGVKKYQTRVNAAFMTKN